MLSSVVMMFVLELHFLTDDDEEQEAEGCLSGVTLNTARPLPEVTSRFSCTDDDAAAIPSARGEVLTVIIDTGDRG